MSATPPPTGTTSPTPEPTKETPAVETPGVAVILVNGVPHVGRVSLRIVQGGGWSIEDINVAPKVRPPEPKVK